MSNMVCREQVIATTDDMDERIAGLLAYLKAAVQYSASGGKLDVGQFDEVLWLEEFPDACQAFDWADDSIDLGVQPAWLGIDKPGEPSPAPEPPASLLRWMRPEELADTGLEEGPQLLEAIFIAGSHQRKLSELDDAPGIHQLHEAYIGAWKSWRDERRAAEKQEALYAKLFAICQQIENEEDIYELVMGFGLLEWRRQGDEQNDKWAPLRRHLLVHGVSLNKNPQNGAIAIAPQLHGAALVLESDMLGNRQELARADLTRLNRELARFNGADDSNETAGTIGQVERILRAWVNAHAAGQYSNKLEAGTRGRAPADPVVCLAPALILRRRDHRAMSRFFVLAADGLRSLGTGAVSPAIRRMMGEQGCIPGVYEPSPDAESSAPADLLFPLPASEDKLQIGNELGGSQDLLVLGPPGTGKSSLIANVICHLLAHDQRVLITSEAVRPLHVLRDMLPEPLRKLCVSYMGEDPQSQKVLTESVEEIFFQNAQGVDQAERQKAADQLRERLEELRGEEARLLDSLEQAARLESESRIAPLHYPHTRQELALELRESEARHAWLGEVPFEAGSELEIPGWIDDGHFQQLVAEAALLLLDDPKCFEADPGERDDETLDEASGPPTPRARVLEGLRQYDEKLTGLGGRMLALAQSIVGEFCEKAGACEDDDPAESADAPKTGSQAPDQVPDSAHDEHWQARIVARAQEFSLRAAWQWHWAHAWLLAEHEHADHAQISAELDACQSQIRETTGELAGELAWMHCLGKLDAEDVGYLGGWQQLVSSLPKTKEAKKYPFFMRKARAKLERCANVVPAWVMPLRQVTNWFEPRRFDGANLAGQQRPFDVAIIDEASQSRVEALALFFLARKVIVIGDPKQNMPATAFMGHEAQVNLVNTHLAGFEHKENLLLQFSFLEIYQSFFNPRRLHLREHYRSVPEIINFCNENFYTDDRVSLFPLRQATGHMARPAIRCVYVPEGAMTVSGSRKINRGEADAVVEQIRSCMASEQYLADGGRKKTMGVISLQGADQAELIMQNLQSSPSPSAAELLERKLVCGTSRAFQGDERDVMFLSLVASRKTDSGDTNVINAQTTEEANRIFNVAMSRAREQVWLFHSVRLDELKPSDLRYKLLEYCLRHDPDATSPGELDGDGPKKPGRTPNTAPRGRLQTEEEIARYRALQNSDQRSRNAVPAMVDQNLPFDSWFELDVFLDICDLGFDVVPQFQPFGLKLDYAIDLLVKGPRGDLAVECDGRRAHDYSDDEKFRSDLLRQRTLESCGWVFHRIRASAYCIDPERARSDLHAAIVERCQQPKGVFVPAELLPDIEDQGESVVESGGLDEPVDQDEELEEADDEIIDAEEPEDVFEHDESASVLDEPVSEVLIQAIPNENGLDPTIQLLLETIRAETDPDVRRILARTLFELVGRAKPGSTCSKQIVNAR